MQVIEYEVLRIARVTMDDGSAYMVADSGLSRLQHGYPVMVSEPERLRVSAALEQAIPRIQQLQKARSGFAALVRNSLAPPSFPVR